MPGAGVSDGSPLLSRSLASTCTSVIVTGSGLSSSPTSISSSPTSTPSSSLPSGAAAALDMNGVYEDGGGQVFGRAVFYEVGGGANILYWTEGVSIEDRRGLAEAERGGAELEEGADRNHGLESRAARLPGPETSKEKVGDESGNAAEGRSLVECDRGVWMLRSTNDTYPAFAVFDCASHPAGVTSEGWYSIPCRDCNAVPVDGFFSMECATTSSDDIGDFTPGPTPPPFTNYPAVQILNGFATIAPGVAVTVDSAHATCDTVQVTNADTDGEYTATGKATDGRFIYEHSGGSTLQWYSLGRRRLHPTGPREERRLDNRLSLDSARRLHDKRNSDSRGGEIGGEDGATLLEGASKGDGRVAAAKDAEKALAACSDGAWVWVGPSGTYPITVAYDCAIHPADVSSIWYDQISSADYLQSRDDQVSITCPGDTSWSSFSPGVREIYQPPSSASTSSASLDNGSPSSGAGSDEAEEQSISGSRPTVLEGLLISGGLLVGTFALGACVSVLYLCHRKRTRERQHAFSMGAAGEQQPVAE